jgi:hypothetical protein
VELLNFALALQSFLVPQVCRNPLDNPDQFVQAALQSLPAGSLLAVNHFIQRTGSLEETVQILQTRSRFGQKHL